MLVLNRSQDGDAHCIRVASEKCVDKEEAPDPHACDGMDVFGGFEGVSNGGAYVMSILWLESGKRRGDERP